MNPIQIVATIGPASKEEETIGRMIDAGMSLARLNFSWGTHEEHATFVAKVRAQAQLRSVHIPIIQDLSGPRVQKEDGHTFNPESSVITEKDLTDLAFTVDVKPEYVALSFVRTHEDVRELRSQFVKRGIEAKIIAKIERSEALADLPAIIAVSDGIMIARGDLGESVPIETLPFVENDILQQCAEAKTPVIVATEMLTSMLEDADPSRADVSDIAQAVLDGASATMLSNETAMGAYPIEAIALMRKVVDEALIRMVHPSTTRF